MVLFSTGRGLGGRLGDRAGDQGLRQSREPIESCPATWDVDAGRIIEDRGNPRRGSARRSSISSRATAAGQPTKSEALGHQEFILTYKTFEPLGPSCLPV